VLAVLVVVGLVVKLWLALLALALGGLPTIWSGHAIVVVPPQAEAHTAHPPVRSGRPDRVSQGIRLRSAVTIDHRASRLRCALR